VVEDGGDAGYAIEGDVTFGPAYEGPPGHVHGGYVCAMFDELLGFAQLSGGFTGTLTIVFRRPTPLNRRLLLRAWVDRVEGRKRFIRGTAHAGDALLTEAEGIFIAPREGYIETVLRASAQPD
jgi:acyl-coenzyme A thioesterase PaaI-like protein